MKLLDRIKKAEPGTSLVYHTGFGLKGAQCLDVLRKLYDKGEIEFFQKRISFADGFAYIAYFRHRPAKVDFHGSFYAFGLVS